MKTFLRILIFSTFFMANLTIAEAQDSQLFLKIERYTSAGEINLRTYIKNIEEHEGFRLTSIEVVAGALNETATATVFVNGTQQGQELQFGQLTLKFDILLNTNFFMGQGAEDVIIRTTNPAHIKTVTLFLTR